MPENKEMDSNLKELVDYLYSPAKATFNESGENIHIKLFKQVFPSIWKYLGLGSDPDLVKFEAFLINVIYHINEINKGMTERKKRNIIKKRDNNLLAFGLLRDYYHTKIDEYGIESWHSVQERDGEYLDNSDYVVLEHPDVTNEPRNSQIWKKAQKNAKAALYTSDIRAKEDVTVKMTEWMNEGSCIIHLQEGIDKFIDKKSGCINLPELCYTLANFPLNEKLDIVKTNDKISSPDATVEEFDLKEDNFAKITLPINEPKGSNANKNSFDAKENKVPRQIEKDEICTEGEGASDISSDEKTASASSPLNGDDINAEKEKPDTLSEESSEGILADESAKDSETNNSELPPSLADELYDMFSKLRSDNTYFEAIVEKLDYIPTEIAFSQHRIFCKLYITKIIQQYCRNLDETEFLLAMYGLLQGFEDGVCRNIDDREKYYFKYTHNCISYCTKKLINGNIHKNLTKKHECILKNLTEKLAAKMYKNNEKLNLINSIIKEFENSNVFDKNMNFMPEPSSFRKGFKRIPITSSHDHDKLYALLAFLAFLAFLFFMSMACAVFLDLAKDAESLKEEFNNYDPPEYTESNELTPPNWTKLEAQSDY